MTVQQALELALRHHQAGELVQAEAIYRQVLAVEPGNVDALHLLGVIAGAVGRHDAAEELIARAIGLRGDVPEFYRNLGLAQQGLGKLAEACASFSRAAELKPDWSEMHARRGALLGVMGKIDEAIVALRRGVELEPQAPDVAGTLANLGSMLAMNGELDEAVVVLRRAIEKEPGAAQVHHNLANALRELGRVEEAVEEFREALRLKPDYATAWSGLLLTVQYRQVEPKRVMAVHREWAARLPSPQPSPGIPGEGGSSSSPRPSSRVQGGRGGRIRVGYVSPDFREHAMRYFLEPLIAAHDRERVEVICYSDVQSSDAVTERFRALADRWRDVRGMGHDELARQVRADEVDVLVDLAVHSGANRLMMFAQRAAPVQVSYLGYAATSGVAEMDWRLTDEWVDPQESEGNSIERLWKLAGGFCCYRPPESAPEVVEREGEVRFGSFNNLAKISPCRVELWGQILSGVKGSKLVVQAKGADQPSVRARMMGVLSKHGIGSERVEFVGVRPMGEYLRMVSSVDVMLDTYPFNGHTTTCHGLWMGAAVVTRHGSVSVSRVGLSLMNMIGLGELAVGSDQEYVERAEELAGDRARMKELRRTMRQRMRSSPLMDGKRLAREVEKAFTAMCGGDV